MEKNTDKNKAVEADKPAAEKKQARERIEPTPAQLTYDQLVKKYRGKRLNDEQKKELDAALQAKRAAAKKGADKK